MQDAAALRALLTERLEALRPQVLAVLRGLPRDPLPEDVRLHLEIEDDDGTETFPAALHIDGRPPEGSPWATVEPLIFQSIPAPLTRADVDAFILWEEGPHGPQHAIQQPVVDGARLADEVMLPWLAAVWAEAGLSNLPVAAWIGVHDRAERTPLTRAAAQPQERRPRAIRNPLMAKDGPPVALNVRAARWGAIAVVLGALVLAKPVYDGWSAAQARIAADPSVCGTRVPSSVPAGQETNLHAEIVQFFIERCEVPR